MKMYDILKRSLKEVQQPLSQGEKNFKALHNPDYKNLVPGVTDQEHVFNGSAQRKDPKTASYEGNASEKAYDKTLKREQAEHVDEASKSSMAKPKMYSDTMKKAAKFNSSNISKMQRDEKARKAAMQKEEAEQVDEAKQYIEVKNRHTGAVKHIEVHPSRAFEALNKYKDKNNTARIVTKKPVKEDAEQVDEAVNPIEVASNPEMYETDTLKKAYYHKKANEDDKKILARHLDRRHGVRDWRKSMKEERVDEVLTKKTSMGDTIADFVHSKNPKFAGKSKKERMKQAMAAYYSKQRNEAYEDNDYVADEVSMVRTELKAIVAKAQDMMDKMSQSMHIEPWVQSKIATAKEMVSGVHDYMVYGEDDKTPAAPSYDQSSQMASSYGNFMNRMGEDYVVEKKGDDEDESDRAANKNIINQMRKAPVDGMHKLTFENGKKHMVQPKHVARALEIHANTPVAKGAKEDLQNALGRSHEDFMHVVNHGKAPAKVNKPRVSLGSMKKEDADPTTKQASRGAMIIRVINGRPEFVRASKKEIKVEELVGGQKKLDKNHNGKLDKMDFKLLRKKKKMMESEEMTASNVAKAAATQTEFSDVGNRNMQQDSVDKIKTDPLASKEKIKLPPTQGNKPIGGYTQTHPNVAEEILLNKLYDTLSEENRIKFESMLESDEGIDALLAFAEEHEI